MGSPNAGLFTSTTEEWPTPGPFFDTLDREFGFNLDPCASADNAKCERFFTKADDGLRHRWDGVVFMNPPYGRVLGAWAEKAYTESRHCVVVGLIPARTDTAYWHRYVMRADEIRLIRGRLHFDCVEHRERVSNGSARAHNAPFPSAVVVWRPGVEGLPRLASIDRSGSRVRTEGEGE